MQISPIKSFFLGILAAFFALFLELSLSLFFPTEKQVYFFTTFSIFLVLAAFSEEVIKYAVIFQAHSKLEKKWQIIHGGFLVGLGFSGTEVFLNYYSHTELLSIPFYFLLGMIFLHIFTSLFAANVIAKKQNIAFMTIRSLVFNTAIHIIYNVAIIFMF